MSRSFIVKQSPRARISVPRRFNVRRCFTFAGLLIPVMSSDAWITAIISSCHRVRKSLPYLLRAVRTAGSVSSISIFDNSTSFDTVLTVLLSSLSARRVLAASSGVEVMKSAAQRKYILSGVCCNVASILRLQRLFRALSITGSIGAKSPASEYCAT